MAIAKDLISRDRVIATVAELLRGGSYIDAVDLLTSLLRAAPNDVDAIHLLGVAYLQLNDLERAEALVARAIELSPRNADFLSNYGIVKQKQGDSVAAEASFNKALKLNRRHADSLLNLGVMYRSDGRLVEALDCFRRAASCRPSAVALANIGSTLCDLGRFDEAIKSLDEALKLDENYAQALVNLGSACLARGYLDRAVSAYTTALTRDPSSFQALSGRGAAFLYLRKVDSAWVDLNKAVALAPNDLVCCRNFATVLLERGDYEKAMEYANRAIAVSASDSVARFVRGAVFLQWENQVDAIADFECARETDRSNPRIPWNLSVCHLQLGRFDVGWQLYEYRWEALPRELVKLKTSRPSWTSADIGKRLLIWSEQGAGDEVFFSGALASARRLSDQVTVQIDGRLMELFARSFPDFSFVPRRRHVPEDSYDVHLPIGSILPFVYRDLNRIPEQRKIPYLVADPNVAAALRQDLRRDYERVVGVTWQSKNLKHGASKSFALHDLLPILQQPGVRFVALQYGDIADELAAFYEQTGVRIDVVPQIDNFHDLDGHAALIEACDFIVSGCNTTAHVAGALNKPGFIAVPFGQAAFWYWHNQSAGRSFWYPSLRLFKHERGLAWAETMLKVNDAVNAYLGAGCE
jgi:tetratricopeptide (TPR) repeat protein